jgi:hypothetical protein
MKTHDEKQSSQNQGTRRADRMSDQGGRRSQEAEKARKAHESEPRPTEPETSKQK